MMDPHARSLLVRSLDRWIRDPATRRDAERALVVEWALDELPATTLSDALELLDAIRPNQDRFSRNEILRELGEGPCTTC